MKEIGKIQAAVLRE